MGTHAHLVIVSYQWALTLTWVHLAYLLYEGLIKTCNYSTTYWNHKVFVQALYKGVDSSHTGALMTDNPRKYLSVTSVKVHHIVTFKGELQINLLHALCSEECWYLLNEVHAFGRLHAICIVNYVGNIMLAAETWQLLKPARPQNKQY